MDIAGLIKSLEASGLATTIRNSLFLFPLIESVHVIGLTMVFGTIVIIDCGFSGSHRRAAHSQRSRQTFSNGRGWHLR